MITDGIRQSLSDAVCPEFDETKHKLGALCKYKHEWGSTGKTLRYISVSPNCVVCARDRAKQHNAKVVLRRQATRQQKQEQIRDLLVSLGGNPETHYLGKFCKKEGHSWNNTGYSLRHIVSQHCVFCTRERVREWKINNPDERKRLANEYGIRHRVRLRLKGRMYYWNNREKCIQNGLRWERENPEKAKAKFKRYRQSPAGKANQMRARHRRRTKIKRAQVHYTATQLKQRLLDFNNECAYCQAPLSFASDETHFHWDHVYPLDLHGYDSIDNLLPACPSCNISKSNFEPHTWFKSQPFYSKKRWQLIVKVLGQNPEDNYQIPLF